MKDINHRIGRRLADVRKARGLSQTALGALLGVSFQQVQKYENGKNRLSAASMVTLCHKLEISVTEFMGPFDQPGANPLPAPLDEALVRALRRLDPAQIQVVTAVAMALK